MYIFTYMQTFMFLRTHARANAHAGIYMIVCVCVS